MGVKEEERDRERVMGRGVSDQVYVCERVCVCVGLSPATAASPPSVPGSVSCSEVGGLRQGWPGPAAGSAVEAGPVGKAADVRGHGFLWRLHVLQFRH